MEGEIGDPRVDDDAWIDYVSQEDFETLCNDCRTPADNYFDEPGRWERYKCKCGNRKMRVKVG